MVLPIWCTTYNPPKQCLSFQQPVPMQKQPLAFSKLMHPGLCFNNSLCKNVLLFLFSSTCVHFLLCVCVCVEGGWGWRGEVQRKRKKERRAGDWYWLTKVYSIWAMVNSKWISHLYTIRIIHYFCWCYLNHDGRVSSDVILAPVHVQRSVAGGQHQLLHNYHAESINTSGVQGPHQGPWLQRLTTVQKMTQHCGCVRDQNWWGHRNQHNTG